MRSGIWAETLATCVFDGTLGFAHALAGNRAVAMTEYKAVADALQANPSLLKPDQRLWQREHQYRMPLSKQDAFYLHYSYGQLLSCAGDQAAAAHQHRLAVALYPGADLEQVFGSDDPHGC